MDEEMKKLWNHLYDTEYVDVVLIQCYSGWRPQELGLIKIKNIDLDRWFFTVGMKTDAGKDRLVPIVSQFHATTMSFCISTVD